MNRPLPGTLLNPDRISAMDSAAALDRRVDADADLVVLGCRAQDTRIPRQVPLGQGRHDTADAGPGDTEANRIADGERVANPGILDEVLLTRARATTTLGRKRETSKRPCG